MHALALGPLALDRTSLLALDQNKVTPGILGFLVFLALGAATWLLLKSMNRHFHKVDFVEEPDPEAEEASARGAREAHPEELRDGHSERLSKG